MTVPLTVTDQVSHVSASVEPRVGSVQRFDFEDLDVYKFALRLSVECDRCLQDLPRGRAYVGDQLRRAALSVVSNIAEGAGEYAAREKARFYRMARRSAAECAAIIDFARQLELFPVEAVARCREILFRVVSMLVKLIRAQRY